MYDNIRSSRTLRRALLLGATLGGVVGFAGPVTRHASQVGFAGPVTRHAPQGAFTVQVRDFPSASSVTVIGWANASPIYGLRTDIPRKGGAWRYHWLYVATSSVSANIEKAQGMSRPLPLDKGVRDDQNCVDGKCSPPDYFRARITDDLLRANKGNVAVTFVTSSSNELPYRLRPDMVDAYLATVDSVRAALGKK